MLRPRPGGAPRGGGLQARHGRRTAAVGRQDADGPGMAASRLAYAPTGCQATAHRRIRFVKVIASSLRKGNIVDLDGKLYVVLNAESFHPGKGTPTTQVDMRRISDGVKV